MRAEFENEDRAAIEHPARLAPVSTFFLSAYWFVSTARSNALIWFALTSPVDRRHFILEGEAT